MCTKTCKTINNKAYTYTIINQLSHLKQLIITLTASKTRLRRDMIPNVEFYFGIHVIVVVGVVQCRVASNCLDQQIHDWTFRQGDSQAMHMQFSCVALEAGKVHAKNWLVCVLLVAAQRWRSSCLRCVCIAHSGQWRAGPRSFCVVANGVHTYLNPSIERGWGMCVRHWSLYCASTTEIEVRTMIIWII